MGGDSPGLRPGRSPGTPLEDTATITQSDAMPEITISATAVAWYAALVSTASLALGLFLTLRDRPRIRVTARTNWVAFGESEYDPEERYICITVANRGRRPVTIHSVGLESKGKGPDYLSSDSMRKGPREVGEGKAESYFLAQSGLDTEAIRNVIVVDQTGRKWRARLERGGVDAET